jgi:hypothetical protein
MFAVRYNNTTNKVCVVLYPGNCVDADTFVNAVASVIGTMAKSLAQRVPDCSEEHIEMCLASAVTEALSNPDKVTEHFRTLKASDEELYGGS